MDPIFEPGSLFDACYRGDLPLLEKLYSEGHELNCYTDVKIDYKKSIESAPTKYYEHPGNFKFICQAVTPLMVAARSTSGANLKTVQWLIEHGAWLYTTSVGGVTAAWYAASRSDWYGFDSPDKSSASDRAARLAYLLDCGLDPDETTINGRSLLVESCFGGDSERVRVLLDRGVKPTLDRSYRAMLNAQWINITTEGIPPMGGNEPQGHVWAHQIPLFAASMGGNTDCIQLLLDSGGDPNEREGHGFTALAYAATRAAVETLHGKGTRPLSAAEIAKNDADELDIVLSLEKLTDIHFSAAQALLDIGVPLERIDRDGLGRREGFLNAKAREDSSPSVQARLDRDVPIEIINSEEKAKAERLLKIEKVLAWLDSKNH